MTYQELTKKYQLKTADVARRFEVPYRTAQNWKLGLRECPSYVVKMMDEILHKERE